MGMRTPWRFIGALCSLALVSAALAQTVSHLLATGLAPDSPARLSTTHLPPTAHHSPLSHDHLFDPTVDPTQLPLSTLPISLQGIVYPTDFSRPSVAIISSGTESRAWHVGETLRPSARLTAILPQGVILQEGERFTQLPLLAPAKLHPSKLAHTPATTPSSSDN